MHHNALRRNGCPRLQRLDPVRFADFEGRHVRHCPPRFALVVEEIEQGVPEVLDGLLARVARSDHRILKVGGLGTPIPLGFFQNHCECHRSDTPAFLPARWTTVFPAIVYPRKTDEQR